MAEIIAEQEQQSGPRTTQEKELIRRAGTGGEIPFLSGRRAKAGLQAFKQQKRQESYAAEDIKQAQKYADVSDDRLRELATTEVQREWGLKPLTQIGMSFDEKRDKRQQDIEMKFLQMRRLRDMEKQRREQRGKSTQAVLEEAKASGYGGEGPITQLTQIPQEEWGEQLVAKKPSLQSLFQKRYPLHKTQTPQEREELEAARKSTLESTLWGLDMPSRVATAAGTAGLKGLRGIAEEQGVERPALVGQQEVIRRDPDQVSQMGMILGPKGAAMAPPETTGLETQKQTVPEVSGPTRFGGVPIIAAIKGVVGNPSKLIDVVGQITEAVQGAYSGAGKPQIEEDFNTYAQTLQNEYRGHAERIAQEQGNTSPENVENIYRELVQQDLAAIAVENENAAQLASQIIFDPLNVLTPAALGEKLIRGSKIARKGYEAVRGAGERATAGLRFMPELDILKKAERGGIEGLDPSMGEALGELGARTRMAKAEAQAQTQPLREQAAQAIPAMKGLQTTEKELLTRSIVSGTDLDRAMIEAGITDPNRITAIKNAMTAQEELEQAHAAAREVTGAGRRWDEDTGQLLGAKETEVEGYIPRTVERAEVAETEQSFGQKIGKMLGVRPEGEKKYFSSLTKPARSDISPRSAKARTTEEARWARDPGLRWEEELSGRGQFFTKAVAGGEVKRLREHVEAFNDILSPEALTKAMASETGASVTTKGFSVQLKNAKGLLPESADRLQVALKETTGMDWVPLKKAEGEPGVSLQDIWEKWGGKPGKTVKGEGGTILVPEPIYQRMARLAPISDQYGITAQQAYEASQSWMRDFVVRPYQKLWRGLHTIPAATFAPRNFAGGFGLSLLAGGFKAANPELHGNAIVLALMGAGIGDETMRKIPYTLRSGKTTTLGEVSDLLQSVGLNQQLTTKLGREMVGKGPVAAAGGVLDKILENVTPGIPVPVGALKKLPGKAGEYGTKISKLTSASGQARWTENYQHMVSALMFLDDTTDAAKARMLDDVSKWSGNYARVGKDDQFLREGFGFYSWLRFIVPHTTKQLAENPARMAFFNKVVEAGQREWAEMAPYDPKVQAPYQKGVSMPAPLSHQSPEIRKAVKKFYTAVKKGDKHPEKYLPDINSHKFAVWVMENPIVMGLQFYNLVEGSLKEKVGNEQDLWNALGPIAKAAAMVTGAEGPRGEGVLEVLNPAARQTKDVQNLYKLLDARGAPLPALDFIMRMQAAKAHPVAYPLYEIMEENQGILPPEQAVRGTLAGQPLLNIQTVSPGRRAYEEREVFRGVPKRAYQKR